MNAQVSARCFEAGPGQFGFSVELPGYIEGTWDSTLLPSKSAVEEALRELADLISSTASDDVPLQFLWDTDDRNPDEGYWLLVIPVSSEWALMRRANEEEARACEEGAMEEFLVSHTDSSVVN